MNFKRYLKAGFIIGGISLAYNMLVFRLLGINVQYDLGFEGNELLFLIFLKGFVIGVVLMWLFNVAYTHLTSSSGTRKDEAMGIIFAIFYAVFCLVVFTVGDILLFGSSEGFILFFTLDGVVESFIATVPIKLFHK